MTGIRAKVLLSLVAFVLIAPLVLALSVSFGMPRLAKDTPIAASAEGYASIITDPIWRAALGHSLLVAGVASVIATGVGLAISYVLWRSERRFAKLAYAIALGPILLPAIILGLGVHIFWASVGWTGRIEVTALSHSILFMPLALIILARGFANLSEDMVEAAQIMGASPGRVFSTIILSAMMPYLISSFTLVALISLNDVLISRMTLGSLVETLPVKVFDTLRAGSSPVAAQASMVLSGITFLGVLILAYLCDLRALLGASDQR